ncbi:MAG TPA: hypothetical protein VIN58_13890 [Roseateles sp.]
MVLIFALIALAILMIGAVAVMRSMGSTQFSIGNLGFKRDMANQGERAMTQVQRDFTVGPLVSKLARESNLVSSNYSATMLPTNAQGLPLALLGSDTDFAAVGNVGNDIVPGQGITIRYVVDRLCTAGAPSPDTCVAPADETVHGGGNLQEPSPLIQPTYRLTVRVTGPRGTQSFFQSTFTY